MTKSLSNSVAALLGMGLTLCAADARPAGRIAMQGVEEVTIAGPGAKVNVPLVTIGGGIMVPDEHSKPLNPLVHYAHDTDKVRPAVVGRPVMVYVAGPMLNSGELWRIVELSRDGDSFAIDIEVYRDNAERSKNIPRQTARAVPLGELPAGEYKITITCTLYFMDASKSHLYSAEQTRRATTTFTVSPAEGDQKSPRAVINDADLKPVEMKRTPLPRQLPVRTEMESLSVDGDKMPPLAVGKWTQQPGQAPRKPGQLPKMADPSTADRSIYAVVLPKITLNSYEWADVRTVTWDGKSARITVQVWRDDGPRRKNVPFQPMLVVMLDLPPDAENKGSAEGEYSVEVEYVPLRAPNVGGLYRDDGPKAREDLSAGNKVTLRLSKPADFGEL